MLHASYSKNLYSSRWNYDATSATIPHHWFDGTEEIFYPVVVLTFGPKLAGFSPHRGVSRWMVERLTLFQYHVEPIKEKLAKEVKEQASNDRQCENRRRSDEIKRWVLCGWQGGVRLIQQQAFHLQNWTSLNHEIWILVTVPTWLPHSKFIFWLKKEFVILLR
jgi:FtsZ-binding cell division protein ZapB